MSPRKASIEIKARPTLETGRRYGAQLTGVVREKAAVEKNGEGVLLITLVLQEGPQRGRCWQWRCLLPVYDDSAAAALFRCAGLTAKLGERVAYEDAVGVFVEVIFGKGRDGELEPISFQARKEDRHG